MNWLDRLTWTCEVCRRERQDRKIAVTYRPVPGMEQSFPLTRRNVRHCNDNDDCIAGAARA